MADAPGRYPPVDPGELRHQIEFLEASTGVDASGVGVEYVQRSPRDRTSAKIEALLGTDTAAGGETVSQTQMKVTVRYKAGRRNNMRFQAASGAMYVIRAIDNLLELNEWQVMTCVRIG